MKPRKYLSREDADKLTHEFNLLSTMPRSKMDGKVYDRMREISKELTHSRITNASLRVLKGGVKS